MTVRDGMKFRIAQLAAHQCAAVDASETNNATRAKVHVKLKTQILKKKMSQLYNAIFSEIKDRKIKKQDIAKALGRGGNCANYNLWKSIKTDIVQVESLIKIVSEIGLEFEIVNRRKTRDNVHVIVTEYDRFPDALYNCINLEKEDFGYSNAEVAELVGAPSSRGNVWARIKSTKIKYRDVATICDALGLEIVLKSPERKISYLLNNPKSKK